MIEFNDAMVRLSLLIAFWGTEGKTVQEIIENVEILGQYADEMDGMIDQLLAEKVGIA